VHRNKKPARVGFGRRPFYRHAASGFADNRRAAQTPRRAALAKQALAKASGGAIMLLPRDLVDRANDLGDRIERGESVCIAEIHLVRRAATRRKILHPNRYRYRPAVRSKGIQISVPASLSAHFRERPHGGSPRQKLQGQVGQHRR